MAGSDHTTPRIPAGGDAGPLLLDRLSVIQGDITVQQVDAIVNAANSALRRGGGVDGAIHRAAGLDLQRELDTLGGCPIGECRIERRIPLGLEAADPLRRTGLAGRRSR